MLVRWQSQMCWDRSVCARQSSWATGLGSDRISGPHFMLSLCCLERGGDDRRIAGLLFQLRFLSPHSGSCTALHLPLTCSAKLAAHDIDNMNWGEEQGNPSRKAKEVTFCKHIRQVRVSRLKLPDKLENPMPDTLSTRDYRVTKLYWEPNCVQIPHISMAPCCSFCCLSINSS